jgi:hypothetical protein
LIPFAAPVGGRLPHWLAAKGSIRPEEGTFACRDRCFVVVSAAKWSRSAPLGVHDDPNEARRVPKDRRRILCNRFTLHPLKDKDSFQHIEKTEKVERKK